MTKSVLILYTIIFFYGDGLCQQKAVIDSVLLHLRSTKQDTSHVNAYLTLYLQYHRANLDTAMMYALKAKLLAEELDFTRGVAIAAFRLGTGYRNLRNIDKAEAELVQSISLYELLADKEMVANGYSELGKINFERNEFDQAALHYLKALDLLEAVDNRNSEAKILNDLGTLYKAQRQYTKALDYYKEALTIVRELNFKPGISACLMNIGTIYIRLKDYQASLPYLTESLALKKETKDKLGESRCLLNIGNVHRELGKFDIALDFFNQALELSRGIGNPNLVGEIQYNLAYNEFKRGDYEKAIHYGNESLEQSQVNRDLEMDIKNRSLLADAYASMKRFEKAYEHARMIKFLSDSLYDEALITMSSELDAKYQRAKKDKEIADLNLSNQLKTLELQNRERERSYFVGLAILVLLLVVVLWSRYRIKVKSNEKLKELDKVKSRFFANISHEFRTPLTLIAGCLEDISDNGLANEVDQQRIAVMQKNTKRLHQLIEQLLDLSKLDAGKLQLQVLPISPTSFLNAICSSFSSWATQKNISFTVNIPDKNVQAYIDEDVMEKIVDNLLSNAIKFTPHQGKVSFSARWNADELTIDVADSGPGIQADKVNRIFERFYQGDDSATRRQEGSGIGLALVKELVSLHHGKINVRSQPGEGTVFTVCIPIHEKYYSSTEAGLISDSKSKEALKKVAPLSGVDLHHNSPEAEPDHPIILVVEDNIDLGHYISDHLPEYSILLAGNGVEGLSMAVKRIPDLIISDVMMPEMDGVEFCQKVKSDEKTSHIPVILLTAKADIESRLEGLETGADDYMTKPFNARELQTRVKNLITQREKLKERFSQIVVLKPKDIAITSPDEVFLAKIMSVIEEHLGNSEFSQDDFQREVGMSRMQLHRKLKALTDHSPGEFIRIQRLIRASDMLRTTSNISDVCYQTGFTSLSYFAKCFKKQFGTTPKEYSLNQANTF